MNNSNEYFSNNGYNNKAYAMNNRVACEPFESLSIQTQGTGFVTVKQKTALMKSRIVYGNEKFSPGMFVYVKGDVITMPWTKEEYEIMGKRVILVPEDRIEVVALE